MRLLLEHLRRHTAAFCGVFVLATVNQLLILAEPQILRVVIDRFVIPAASIPWPVFFRGVLTLVCAAVVVALLARVARNLQEYGTSVIAQRVGARLYAGSVAHSLLLPFGIVEDQRSGELLQKMQKARLDAQSGIAQAVRVYLAAVAIIAVTAYAFVVHRLLGILFLLLVPLIAAFVLAISRPVRRQQKQIALETAALAGSTTETMRNLELVKSLGIAEQEIARLDRANERILALEERKLRLVRLFSFAEGTVMNLGRAVLLLVMLSLVHKRAITTGEFLTFFLYAQSFFAPLAELGAMVVRYQESRATFETLDEVMAIAPEAKVSDAAPLGALSAIDLKGVTLRYGGGGRPALEEVDLAIRAGETVAIVGPSGSGKSSIVKLLAGLYPPSAGTLAVNGVDVSRLDIDTLRRRIGLVTHDTHLFAGTIRENLLLVRADATDAQCLEAAARAAAMPILERGGKGLDTVIGEGGLKLSGGERQRIAIARALLRDPELLIFDEATSNLDSMTERAITRTIREIASSAAARMTIIVAHRLFAIAHADRIVVLANGRVVERGTHETLLRDDGLYATMWREQSLGQTT
jgi:ATP-binding cassette subfamily B protein